MQNTSPSECIMTVSKAVERDFYIDFYFLGARAGCCDSLLACPSGQTKELRQIATSLAQPASEWNIIRELKEKLRERW